MGATRESMIGSGLIHSGIDWDEFNASFEKHWHTFEMKAGWVRAKLSPKWHKYEATKRQWGGIDEVLCCGLRDDVLMVEVQPFGFREMDEVYALDMEYFIDGAWLTFHDVTGLKWVDPPQDSVR